MSTYFPIKVILLYITMLFAPPDTDRIVVECPGEPPFEMVRADAKWKTGTHESWIEGGRFFGSEIPGDHDAKIDQFVTVPVGYDWKKEPRFKLGNSTVIERTTDGFIATTATEVAAAKGIYRTRYIKSAATAGTGAPFKVNVLGEVNHPGRYEVRATASLADAVAAAGGWRKTANTRKISVLRGGAGTIPEVTVHNLDAFLKGAEAPTSLQGGDTIYVPEQLF